MLGGWEPGCSLWSSTSCLCHADRLVGLWEGTLVKCRAQGLAQSVAVAVSIHSSAYEEPWSGSPTRLGVPSVPQEQGPAGSF